MAADSQEIDEFLDSMRKCFGDVDQALADENASIPLDYLESRLEDHFQIVNAIAIAIRDNASSDLNQTVEDWRNIFAKLAPGNPYHKGSEGNKRHKVISLGSFYTSKYRRKAQIQHNQRTNRDSEGNWDELEKNSTFSWNK